MLTSPISLVIGANTHSLKRINNDNFGSTYLSKEVAGIEVRLNIRHAYEKATAAGQYERHNIDIQYTTFDEEGKPTLFQAYCVCRNLRGAASSAAVAVNVGLSTLIAAIDTELVDWES